MKNFFLILILLSIQARAITGHDQGSGGGGFCINGKCKTLAEAGFRLKEERFPEPVITNDVITALDQVLDATVIEPTMKSRMRGLSLGMTHQFVKLEISDPNRFAAAKQEYQEILKSNNFPTKHFELFAFTDFEMKTTYLLPAFSNLNSQSQAKILIHEGIIRLSGLLLSALEMDVAIEKTLTGESDLSGVARVYYSLFSPVNPNTPMAGYFRDYYKTNGKPIQLADRFITRAHIDIKSSADAADIYSMDKGFWQTLQSNQIRYIILLSMHDINVPPKPLPGPPPISYNNAQEMGLICRTSVQNGSFLLEALGVPYLGQCIDGNFKDFRRVEFRLQ